MAKMIIDIPDDKYNYFMYSEDFDSDDGYDAIEYICNGTVLDNVTNGAVIKALFPNIDFCDMAFTVHATTNVTSNGVKGGISYDFWKEWWNAPYKPRESEDKG